MPAQYRLAKGISFAYFCAAGLTSPVKTYRKIAAYLQRQQPSHIAGTAVLSPYLLLFCPDDYFTI